MCISYCYWAIKVIIESSCDQVTRPLYNARRHLTGIYVKKDILNISGSTIMNKSKLQGSFRSKAGYILVLHTNHYQEPISQSTSDDAL